MYGQIIITSPRCQGFIYSQAGVDSSSRGPFYFKALNIKNQVQIRRCNHGSKKISTSNFKSFCLLIISLWGSAGRIGPTNGRG